MEMPAPIAAASPTRKVGQLLSVAKAAANKGASVETEPSIRPARPGCTTCSTKSRRSASCSLSRASAGTNLASRRSALASWRRSSAARSPSSCRIEASCESRVEALRFGFHDLGLRADLVEPERPRQPDRLPRDEPFHVLAPDERNVFAKPFAIKIEQAVAVAILFCSHGPEHIRGIRAVRV